MAPPLYSQSWYRVEKLKPRLRSHARIHRHEYRGQVWYVLQDFASERFHRFSRPAYEVIGLMDGNRTVQEIWDLASRRLGDDAPTQDQVVRLLGQLHAADALQMDVLPDTEEFLKRYERGRRRRWLGIILNPLSWKFPLFDPERLVCRLYPLVRPLCGWWGALAWLAIVGTASVLAAMHWSDLSENVLDRVLEPQNLLLLWFVIPLLKIFHEFGHAIAVKAFGGEVHEMGIILLVLTPLPYVDASASSALREKWKRILVASAGILVELLFASLALFFWLNAQPGFARSIAYDMIFIAGASTVLFNANPLLRYDGYYILSDYLEIPNLRMRSNAYCGYLWERYLFGRRDASTPTATPGEKAWFVTYTITSFVYRFFLFAAIILFIASKFFFVGVVLALWAALAWALIPLSKAFVYLAKSPRLREVRFRAVAVSAALVLAGLVALFSAPLPLRTLAEGVVWIPEQSIVRAGTEGFIERVIAAPGSRVKPGDPLILCRDPATIAHEKVLEARLKELHARFDEKWVSDRVEAEIIREEIVHVEKSLGRAREKVEDLTIRSRCEGTFVVVSPQDLPGRYVDKGIALAHVLDLGTLTLRAIVSQADIDLVRGNTRAVDVRLSENLSESFPATVRREVPSATQELPSNALGAQGGGEVATDPFDARGVRAIGRIFQIELELPAPSGVVDVGGRVHVRFDHGWEPVAGRMYRHLRRLFLKRFNV